MRRTRRPIYKIKAGGIEAEWKAATALIWRGAPPAATALANAAYGPIHDRLETPIWPRGSLGGTSQNATRSVRHQTTLLGFLGADSRRRCSSVPIAPVTFFLYDTVLDWKEVRSH